MAARRIVASAVVVAGAAAAVLIGAPSASAQVTRQVTIAARVCPAYAYIRANRARNNIQESLFDLGPNTNYIGPTGNLLLPVSVEKENDEPQDACTPITGWRFTLGTGIQERAVDGLSIVTGATALSPNLNDPPIRTLASTAELNNLGEDTGRTIAGAVTITLTGNANTLANEPSRLWIQGGTPAEPLNDTDFPNQFAGSSPGYGFGALRCAMDALNGDNVEYINFPPSATHVFCFAYYVNPRSQNARIRVCKQVPQGTQPSEDFRFVGNISFNVPNHDFTLTAPPATNRPNCMTFYRGGGNGNDRPVWDFTEQQTPGWRVADITCQSENNTSTATTNVTTGRTDVALGADDLVTCTYHDEPRPPPAGLLLRKITHGGVGTFGFSVNPLAAGPTLSAKATTTFPGVAVAAVPEFDELEPGDYDITEHRPDTDAGSWALERFTCDSQPRASRSTTQRVTLEPNTGTICTFENRFTPKGSIRLRKVTRGGTATTGFVIDTVGVTPPRRFEQAATTTSEGASVLAKGDKTTNLPLGTYEITEMSPAPTATDAWRLDTVVCNGHAVPAALGHIRVVLTADRPHIDCTFTNVLHRAQPLPETATGGDAVSTPVADIVVTKRPSRRTVTLGGTVRYTVRVTNRGSATAHDVVLAEEPGNHQALISATPARYRCSTQRRLPSCVIGTLRPGQTATLTVIVRPRAVGTLPNRVVVVSGTADRSLRNNVARAAARVSRPRPPRFTG